MKRIRNLLFAVSLMFLLLMCDFSLADEPFKVQISPEKVILQSGNLTVSISHADKDSCLRINNYYGIGSRVKSGADEDWLYFSGIHLKEAKSVADKEDVKKVCLIFQNNSRNRLQLDLRIERGESLLFIDSFMCNITDIPQHIEWAWFSTNLFPRYVSSECSEYSMPEEAGVDFTCGMPSKKHWTTLGPSRHEKWIYFPAEDAKIPGIGIIAKKPDSFGMRDDKLVYWGEWEGMVEEGDSTAYHYVLMLTDNAKQIPKEIKVKNK